MTRKFFSQLLSSASTSRRARTLGTLLLVLSPLAYVAAVWLLQRSDPNVGVGLRVGRAEAVRRAEEYAARELGVDVSRWVAGCRAEADNDAHLYFRQRAGVPGVGPLRRLFPEVTVHTMFLNPASAERLEVWLTPDGEPLGYARSLSPKESFGDRGEPAARALAEGAARAAAARYGLTVAGEPELSEKRNFNYVSRRYTWRHAVEGLPELDLRTSITVAGDSVTGQEQTHKIDPAYASKHLINHRAAPFVAVGLSYLLTGLFVFYGLYRYIQRARQKEVAHARSLLLCVGIACVYMFIAFQTDFDKFSMPPDVPDPNIIFLFMMLSTAVAFLLLGLTIGLAYGSSEGDMREAYPGKLTSLDALLTGKLFSKNVARAVCVGCAVGGWVLLARVLILWLWSGAGGAGTGLMEKTYNIILGHRPSLLPVTIAPVGAIVTAVPGLLLPLSLLHRWVRSRRWLLAVLVVLSVAISANVYQDRPLTLVAGLLLACVSAAALLVPFFAFDLLTVIVGLAASSLVNFSAYLAAQPVSDLSRAGYASLALGGSFLLLELLFVFRGREYAEAQVRPLYARHLAERLVLQAEVSAAREAQVRLLPQKPPEVEGLTLAAVCRPAHVVGGDFYDLFVLGDGRLGVFVAEGGSHGLEAAMIIAYAKGFLMPRLRDRHRPSEIICALQARLAPLLEQGQALALVYAVIDRAERTLSYACTGEYPEVVVRREASMRAQADGEGNGGDGAGRGLVYTREREVSVESDLSPDFRCTVREATLQMSEGDAVVFYTDGVARSFGEDAARSAGRWIVGLLDGRVGANGSLQEALAKSLERQARRARRASADDDLTAVVVRLDGRGGA